MEKTRRLSSWETTGLMTSFVIALLTGGWFVVVQAGIAPNESSQSLLLLLHPISGLILIMQVIQQLSRPDWNKFLIWGGLASGFAALISGAAWVQIVLIPSPLN